MASLSWCTHCLPELISPVLGVIIGALIVSYATWPWVFYTTAIIALFIAITCSFLIPSPHPQNKHNRSERFRRLDLSGSMLLMGKRCASMVDYAPLIRAKLLWYSLSSQ